MLARVALDTPVLPPLELLLEPARELLVLVVGLGDLALAAELGQDVGPPRRRGLLRSFLDGAPGVGRGVLALVARDRVREPAVADELRGAGLRAHGRGVDVLRGDHDEVVAFLERGGLRRLEERGAGADLRLPELALERVRADDGDFCAGEAG